MLADGADVNAVNHDGNTPLSLISVSSLNPIFPSSDFFKQYPDSLDYIVPPRNDYEDVIECVIKPIINHIAKLEAAGLYVNEGNLQKEKEFINTLPERCNNYLQHYQNCRREAEEIKKESRPLYDFLRESNIDNLVSIWGKNENVRNKFDNQESLQPEYAGILINKANKVKKKIFLHNHKPLTDVLLIHYECNFKAMSFADIKSFFKAHSSDFEEKLRDEKRALTLDKLVDFTDIAERHIPTLGVQASAKTIRSNAPNGSLNNPESEQHQAAAQARN